MPSKKLRKGRGTPVDLSEFNFFYKNGDRELLSGKDACSEKLTKENNKFAEENAKKLDWLDVLGAEIQEKMEREQRDGDGGAKSPNSVRGKTDKDGNDLEAQWYEEETDSGRKKIERFAKLISKGRGRGPGCGMFAKAELKSPKNMTLGC